MTNEAGPVHSRTRKRTWLLLSLGAVTLVAVLWSALGGPLLDESPLPDAPGIPDPNGYDDVLEAARAIEDAGLIGPKLEVSRLDQAALETVVRASSDAIVRGRAGLAKPFQVPVVYEINHMMNVLMKGLGSIRGGLVRAMIAHGRLAELEGRVDDAAGFYADVIRLGDAMSHGVPMIGYQVSVAIQSTGLRYLRDIRAKLSPEQCRKAIALLEEVDRNRERARNVTLAETRFMNANTRKMGFFASFTMRVSGARAKGLAQVASMLETSEQRQNAARRLLMADLALRVYFQQHGEAPPDLNALVPSILKSAPIDPYSDRRLRYVKRGKDGIVYSVGPDRDDDLAKTLGQRDGETVDGDFTIDSF